jgi:hypothetical protein
MADDSSLRTKIKTRKPPPITKKMLPLPVEN